MLFNSYIFIFAFLPVTFFVYFYLNKIGRVRLARLFLVLSSLFFYSWWNLKYLPIILVSMLFNYYAGLALTKLPASRKKYLLFLGISFNLGLLIYFKYRDFLVENLNRIADTQIALAHLALPLAISFFTFQQIAYLVDSYRGETREYDLLNYANFVTFFPQLIAGPIVHHKEMMPQFASSENKHIRFENIAKGVFIFSIGLFKKVVIADTFAQWASAGFDHAQSLTMAEAWVTSLSYTFQLYFDFSGYTDMAIGAALLFNIRLPINFDSPYKATSIRDFWRRWHITLSRFLKAYIYIPLGGNRKGELRTYGNLMITFLLGGIWHGAGWTFLFWGFLHGVALVIQRVWEKTGIRLHTLVAWFITFNFINIAWVFFRAKEWEDAVKVLKGMFVGEPVLPLSWKEYLSFLSSDLQFGNWLQSVSRDPYTGYWILIGFVTVLLFKNSIELLRSFRPSVWHLLWSALLFLVSLSMLSNVSEFLYFNF